MNFTAKWTKHNPFISYKKNTTHTWNERQFKHKLILMIERQTERARQNGRWRKEKEKVWKRDGVKVAEKSQAYASTSKSEWMND